MTEVLQIRPEQFPLARECPFSPPKEYREIREQDPIAKVHLPGGKWAWAVTRHEDVRAMLSNPRFSSDRADPNFPVMVLGGRLQPDGEKTEKSLISLDAPEHGPARRAVLGEFTVR